MKMKLFTFVLYSSLSMFALDAMAQDDFSSSSTGVTQAEGVPADVGGNLKLVPEDELRRSQAPQVSPYNQPTMAPVAPRQDSTGLNPYGSQGQSPSDQMPQGMPSGQMPQGMPSDQMPQGMPSDQMPQGMPSGQMPQGQPSGQMPQGQPSSY